MKGPPISQVPPQPTRGEQAALDRASAVESVKFFIFSEIESPFAKHYGKDRPAAARDSHPPTQQHPPPVFSQFQVLAFCRRCLHTDFDDCCLMQMLCLRERHPKAIPVNGGILRMIGTCPIHHSIAKSKQVVWHE
jgi:hypothetical protein